MRSFLTRFSNSLIGVVLLVPCLLICLACATPFPFQNLEEGMTAEMVRQKFGAPELIETNPRWDISDGPAVLTGVESSWTYVDEELLWGYFGFLVPPLLLSIPICAAIPDTPWDCLYINTRPVLLHFEAEELVHWNVGEFEWTPGPPPQGPPDWMRPGSLANPGSPFPPAPPGRC